MPDSPWMRLSKDVIAQAERLAKQGDRGVRNARALIAAFGCTGPVVIEVNQTVSKVRR